jgi:hypothetical protein
VTGSTRTERETPAPSHPRPGQSSQRQAMRPSPQPGEDVILDQLNLGALRPSGMIIILLTGLRTVVF